MYEVYLDNISFYGVTAFQYPHDRKLVVYNGIGTGYFPKADDPNLKKWSWECTLQEFPEHYHKQGFTPATQIKAKLDSILTKKEPVRLVMKSEYSSLSEQVLLESYQWKEQYAGVYSVSVNVTEYKEAAVRTTEIPEIPRPGKVPETPPHAVPKDETSYDQTEAPGESWKDPIHDPGHGTIHDPINNTVVDTATGEETIIPVDPDPDKEYGWIDNSKKDTYINNITGEAVEAPGINWGNVWGGIKDKFFPDFEESALGGIVNSYNEYRDKIGKENEKLIEQMKNGNQWGGM